MSVVGDEELVRRWASRHGLTEPIATATGNVLTPLGLEGVPAIAFVMDGEVRAVAQDGARASDFMDELLRARDRSDRVP